MKKITIIKSVSICLFFLNFTLICAQPAAKIWDKRFGGVGEDELQSIISVNNGAYLLGGWSTSGVGGEKTEARRGNQDYWVVKIDGNGNKVWDKTFGGNDWDVLNSQLTTNDGGYLLGGTSNSGANGDKSQASQGDADFWIVKIDENGSKVWDKRFGGTWYDDLVSMVATNDGGYLLGGRSNSDNNGDKTQFSYGGSFDYWIIKIDENGNKIWDKRFGGTNNEYLSCMIKTSDGNFLLGGFSYSGISGDKTQTFQGYEDYWIVKIDGNGNKIWDKTFGGTAPDNMKSIVPIFDGGFLLGGDSYSGASGDKTQLSQGSADYWIVRIDEFGNKIWDLRFGGADYDFLEKIIQTTDNGFLLTGYSSSGLEGDKTQTSRGENDCWIVKIDDNGNKIWDKRFGAINNDYLRDALITVDGDFMLGGTSDSNANGDKTQPSIFRTIDYWLIKVSGLCSLSLNLVSTSNDISNQIVIKGDNSKIGTINATNKIKDNSNVIYRAGNSINLNAGFVSENGTVFKTEINGCSN